MNLKAYWDDHGTKILGSVTVIGTAMNGGDHYLTQILSNAQHAMVSLTLTLVGIATVQRGFTNSKKINDAANKS